MVAMAPTEFDGAVPVDGYGPGFFRVAGEKIIGPVIVTGAGPRAWSGLDDAAALTDLAGAIDVLFIGIGPEVGRLPAPLAAALDAAGLMVETMATPTAANGYIVARQMGGDADLYADILTWQTVLAVLSIPFILSILA